MPRIPHAPLFHRRRFPDDVIIRALQWYLRYSLSYRDLQELLAERGVNVDHTTLWRWVNRYGPELDQRIRAHLVPTGAQWRVDETYIRVGGEWVYEYRAVDALGATVDFFLSTTRDEHAAKLFLRKAMAAERRMAPQQIVVDGNPTYPIAVRALQREGLLPPTCRCRCSHADNNLIEQDHRAIQRRADAKQHFREFSSARRTIAGYEAMHMLRKGQAGGAAMGDSVAQAAFVHRLLTLAV
jgi:transposase, IS6 family